MLHYDKIDVSEGNDLTKSNRGKEFFIPHYCFFNYGFKFQDYLCAGCHDLTILSVNINDIDTTTVTNADYCCIIYAIIHVIIHAIH